MGRARLAGWLALLVLVLGFHLARPDLFQGEVRRVFRIFVSPTNPADEKGASQIWLAAKAIALALPASLLLYALIVRRAAALGRRLAPGERGPALAGFALLLVLNVAYVLFAVERSPTTRGDELIYLHQAKIFSSGRVSVPAPEHFEFFRQVYMTTYPERFSVYPPLHPLVLVPGLLIGEPYVVPIALGLASLLLVLRFHRAAYGHEARWDPVLILLVATSPFYIHTYSTLLSYATGATCVLLALVCLAEAERGRAARWLLGVGLSTGAAFLARPSTGVCLLAGVAIAMIIRPTAFRRGGWRGLGALGLGLGAFLAAQLWYDAATTGSPFTLPYHAVKSVDDIARMGFGVNGHTPEVALQSLFLNGFRANLLLLGSAISLIFVLLHFLRRQANSWDVIVLLWALLFPTFFFFYWSQNVWRYSESVPLLLLLTRRGIESLERVPLSLPGSLGGHRIRAVALVTAMVIVSLLTIFPEIMHLRRSQVRGYRLLFDITEASVRLPAIVFIRNPPYFSPERYVSANSPDMRDPILYAMDMGTRNDRRILGDFAGRHAYLFEFNPAAPERSVRPLAEVRD
jgi:hypothetical protein